jgi:hypothetical protein
VTLAKATRFGTLSALYDTGCRTAGLSYSRRGLQIGARLGHVEGRGWSKPSLQVAVEPLSLLGL